MHRNISQRLAGVDEQLFKTTYIANFLATYMANRYERDCTNGHKSKPYEHQPIEDASFLADCAWESMENLK